MPPDAAEQPSVLARSLTMFWSFDVCTLRHCAVRDALQKLVWVGRFRDQECAERAQATQTDAR